jgi:hypothetical protein
MGLPGFAAAVLLVAGASTSATDSNANSRAEAERAVNSLNLDRAIELLGGLNPELAAFTRARVAMYRGDCEAAMRELQRTDPTDDRSLRLLVTATRCHGAMSGAERISDGEHQVEVRVQDAADRVLVPRILDVATQTRQALVRELGVELPSPLRIDVVRDHFSLSALTGLPLKAAETTGTVGIARFGRVILLTPRAATHGYPWEDTLAHELTHVAVSQASADRAPLWIQEGLAKRYEASWRTPFVFERPIVADAVARTAMASGNGVGIDAIGPSVAMLPSANAARIAFAEVRSFMDFWVRENGAAGLRLLLAEMRQNSPDVALESTTGYPLVVWIERWKRWLQANVAVQESDLEDDVDYGELVRRRRLGRLLADVGAHQQAIDQFGRAHAVAPADADARVFLGEELEAAGQPDSVPELALETGPIEHPTPAWLAFHSRHLAASATQAGADAATERDQNAKRENALRILTQARSADPFSERTACTRIVPVGAEDSEQNPAQEALCTEAKRLGRD